MNFAVVFLAICCPGILALNGLTDIIENAGVLLIKLGPAKLRRSYHTFIHYYDTSIINRELRLIQDSLGSISKFALSNDTYAPSLTLIRTVGEKILEKTRFLGPSRYARGIANFLGRGLSWLTGNLDDTDKDRYDALLRNLDKTKFPLLHKFSKNTA